MTQLLLYFTLIISSPVSGEEAYGKNLSFDIEYATTFADQVNVAPTQNSLVNNSNNDYDSFVHIHPIVTAKKTGHSYFTFLSSELLKNIHNSYPIRAPPLNSFLFV